MQAFYPQHAGGEAIANALLGHCADGLCWGRLPYTWPHDLTHAGDIGDYRMLGTKKTFRYGQPALFPFGFGLQYGGPFVLRDLSVSASVIAPCDSVELGVTLRNTGRSHGSEVLQVYLRWLGAPVPTPALELVQFDRVFVRSGEQARVTLTVDPRRMALLLPPSVHSSSNGSLPDWWVVPLRMELSVGSSQPAYGSTLTANVTIAGGEARRVAECPSARGRALKSNEIGRRGHATQTS